MSMAAVRDNLAATAEETLKLARQLAADARDTDVPVAELVAQATMLGRLEQRREALIGELRRTTSAGIRRSQPGRPIREVVLEALGELGWPQNARFLEEYLWARQQLQLDSRAFASLRRDELRAWRRSPGARSAYIVPALNPDGTANPRWLTSSAWELPRRVVASTETERLFDLQKIIALRVRGSRGPLGTLLERSVAQILAIEPPPVSASLAATRAWRTHVRAHAAALIEATRSRDDEDRGQIAVRLAGLPEHDRIWGTGSVGQALRATPAQAIERITP
ncbi:hypothetical protein [Trebonia kvetii]|nr:hypothetical protein [Trebonia kvetii]